MLDEFISDKDGPMFKLAMHAEMKTRDHFLRTRKKVGPFLSLKAGKQSAFAIVEAEAPIEIQKRSSFQKGKEKSIKTPSLTGVAPKEPKGKTRATSPFKTYTKKTVPRRRENCSSMHYGVE